jgi:outer membrane lipoprotein-sorting protein
MTATRKWQAVLLFSLALTGSGLAQAGKESSDAALNRVVREMDATAAKFKQTQADFTWTQWEAVVSDIVDTQKGKIYFRRSGDQTEMAADITTPSPGKYVLFVSGELSLYESGPNRVTKYNATKNRAEFETFLVLGFGGSGDDMLKSFDVKYVGTEKVMSAGQSFDTDVVDLTPKSEKVRKSFTHITLWIDRERGVSVQQKLFDSQGDYRLAQYSNIEINEKIPDNAFKLKTNGKTTVLSQGQ